MLFTVILVFLFMRNVPGVKVYIGLNVFGLACLNFA